jgi:hypothetical protein
MPFGKAGSETERHYRIVYENIIKRAVNAGGYRCLRADEFPESGPIPERVKEELRNAALVLADLSDRNPNVFYELGFRHALNKPSITISDDVSSLPFNVSTYSTIQYSIADIVEADMARDKITKFARKELEAIERLRIVGGKPRPANEIEELHQLLDRGFSNLQHLIGDRMLAAQQQAGKQDDTAQTAKLDEIVLRLNDIQKKAEGLSAGSRLLQQTTDLGLVNLYPSRLDAIEDEFFDAMLKESKGIDVVGSTLFGLKGRHHVTQDRILELLTEKVERPGFRLRLLLTHWDFISHRQDQEKTEKNITRYVISKEMKEAVDILSSSGLSEYVRFYRAAPTCFTVICRGEGMMLANPYPYQKEAYNSWTAIFRSTGHRGVYDAFSEAHFDGPWSNEALAVPFSQQGVTSVAEVLRRDLEIAQAEITATMTK